FKMFADLRGEDLRKFAFDRAAPESAYSRLRAGQRGKVIETLSGGAEVLKNFLNLMGAGELAPRFREFKTRLEQLGWTEERIVAEVRKAQAAAKVGGPYVDPVPFHIQLEALNAAAEVTVPFGRQGVVTRELNKIQPFFGPAVAGLSRAVRTWRTNTK